MREDATCTWPLAITAPDMLNVDPHAKTRPNNPTMAARPMPRGLRMVQERRLCLLPAVMASALIACRSYLFEQLLLTQLHDVARRPGPVRLNRLQLFQLTLLEREAQRRLERLQGQAAEHDQDAAAFEEVGNGGLEIFGKPFPEGLVRLVDDQHLR